MFLIPEREKGIVLDEINMVHGGWNHPIDEYLMNPNDDYFSSIKGRIFLSGHTHLPIIFHYPDNGVIARPMVPEPNTEIILSPRAIINPGSVGQPRDRDPRSSYMLFDPEEETLEYHRVSYDIQVVQERMRVAGLPDRHIKRLEGGW